MMAPRQLELFAASRGRKPPVTAGQIRLARRAVRVVTRLRAVREDEVHAILGCDQGDARTAIGIAVQWRRIDRRSGGFLVPAAPPEGRQA